MFTDARRRGAKAAEAACWQFSRVGSAVVASSDPREVTRGHIPRGPAATADGTCTLLRPRARSALDMCVGPHRPWVTFSRFVWPHVRERDWRPAEDRELIAALGSKRRASACRPDTPKRPPSATDLELPASAGVHLALSEGASP
jgi:hypothetical protein